MAEQELYIVRLQDDFYRDGFYKAIAALCIVVSALIFLIIVSIYLFFSKPQPIEFITDNDWRTLPLVPIEKPYLNEPDLLQWVSEVLPRVFKYDFLNYKIQLDQAPQYFTPNGWTKFSEIINNFVSYDTVQEGKLFVKATPTSPPIILNQGLLQGKYAWWVKMTLNLNYVSVDRDAPQAIEVQALVVRIPTLQNLDGVSIDNIIVKRI